MVNPSSRAITCFPGWLFEKPKRYGKLPKVDMSDLDQDPGPVASFAASPHVLVVVWNRAYTGPGVIVLGLILPAVLGY